MLKQGSGEPKILGYNCNSIYKNHASLHYDQQTFGKKVRPPTMTVENYLTKCSS
jgi:hypothetical protein